jgi:phosphogluconate dehydratase
MLMEIMGLHTPGASFVNPNTPLRDALTREARSARWRSPQLGNEYTPVGRMIDERSSSTASSACMPPAARPTTPSI